MVFVDDFFFFVRDVSFEFFSLERECCDSGFFGNVYLLLFWVDFEVFIIKFEM